MYIPLNVHISKHQIIHKVLYFPKARSVQLKAVVISERVLGFDNPNTIQQYVSFGEANPEKHLFHCWKFQSSSFVLYIQALLGVYAFAGGEGVLAQKCFLRARLLTLTVHGEDHPYVATLDVS